MFKEVNLNLSYSMKYLIPKIIDTKNLQILESRTIFKIKNNSAPIHLFGIPVLLNESYIIKDDTINRYYIVLTKKDSDTINTFNTFLSQIQNYKNISEQKIINGTEKTVIIIYPNSVIEKYYSQQVKSFYINIKYVKKSGFFSYPVLNII